MLVTQADATTSAALKLQDAARMQRRYWKHLRPEDVDYIDLQPMIDAATEIAEVLEQRYRDQKSKAWERWCQSSLATGGRQVVRWIKATEGSKPLNANALGANLNESIKNGKRFGVLHPLLPAYSQKEGGQDLLSRV